MKRTTSFLKSATAADTTLNDVDIFSVDNRQFTERDTLLRALNNADQLYVGQVIYACAKVPGTAAAYLSAKSILSHANFKASQDGGDPFCSEFNNVRPDARDELQDLLNAWAKKHMHGEYRAFVSESREIVLTQAMILAFYARAGLDKAPSFIAYPQVDTPVFH